MKNNQSSVRLFFGMYALGALFCLTLAVLSTWANLEAAFYGFSRLGDERLQGLHCPILLNRNETGVVSVKVSNTTDRRLSPSVTAQFSSPFSPISKLELTDLAPGESQTLQWKVGPENIDMGQFIFSHVFTYSSYPMPDRENTCGTFIIDLPIPGNVLVILLLILGLLGMGGSLVWLWRTQAGNIDTVRMLRPLTFLGVVIAGALFVSLAGLWLQGLLLLTIVAIMIVVTLNFLVFR